MQINFNFSCIPAVICQHNSAVVKLEFMKSYFYARIPPRQLRQIEAIPFGSISARDTSKMYDALRAGSLPFGDESYVRNAMAVLGINTPADISFPDCLSQYLAGPARLLELGSIKPPCFVKPLGTSQVNAFKGFVFDPSRPEDELDEEEWAQLETMRSLPSSTLVWSADPVEFSGKWRYYVADGSVVGYSRYDNGGYAEDDVPLPDMEWLKPMIKTFHEQHRLSGFGLEVGRTVDDRQVLIQVRDGLALTYHPSTTMTRAALLRLLWLRWSQIATPFVSSAI